MTAISLPVTSIAAIFASLLILILTAQVIRLRRKGGVVHGDNDDRVLAKAIRGHANATEQLPIALVVIALAELQGAPLALLLSGVGLLILGRTLHAFYFARHGTHWRLRVYGMWLTIIAQAVLVVALIAALLI